MKIGELAGLAACRVETVRYYEREGLLPAPIRTEGNYRDYGPVHLERLTFIRQCRTLDIPLQEIRQLLEQRTHPEANCDQVNALIDRHIARIEQQMAALAELRSRLRVLRTGCNEAGNPDHVAKHCGILSALSRGKTGRAAKP